MTLRCSYGLTVRNGRQVAGFTLVEVLIALALLSLLMLGLTGAMRAMSQTSESIERRIDSSDRLRVTGALLNSVLGSASVRRLPGGGSTGTAQAIFFEATPNSLAWIGVMPARYGVGGRHYMRLALEGSQVVLRYAPWTGAPVFSAWGSASAQVLAEPVTGFDLRYLEPDTLQWLPAWPPQNLRPNIVLPSAVEATIHGVDPPWPPLVTSMRGLAATDPSVMRGSWGP
ncbi:prepilin-type N-terminal cleavage/methylation domain-containing protein [Ottowia thiooxydans]|uniref:General secretion pathway protein J n=1 Tax=Ottowia thiooxydans TaxID=219182 RepID=A0ABV2QEX3_9BURK